MSTTIKRSALGRGLESLLPSRPLPPTAPEAPPASAAPDPTGRPLEISVELIDRNPYQTRTHFDDAKLDELAASISALGVVQPIVVRSNSDDPARYTLITGERRLLASKKAGKATIPSIVREVSNLQAMEMTIVENLQRADLNPIEQANAYARLSRDFQMTQEQMAIRTGQSRATVTNFLRLLKLPEAIQQLVSSGELSFGHAKCLIVLDSPEAVAAVAQKVMALHLSVRATETYVQGIINPEVRSTPSQAKPHVDPNVREAQDNLRRALGLKVTIEDKQGKGKVIIEYSGIEDFDAILSALGQISN